MPFFKELRRKKTSSKTGKFPNSSNNSNDSNGTVPTTKSSSTINSVYASSTPPSSIQPHQSTPTLVTSKSTGAMTPLPQRPMPLSSVSNRSSFMVRLLPLGKRYVTHTLENSRGAEKQGWRILCTGIEHSVHQWNYNTQAANFKLCAPDIIGFWQFLGRRFLT